MQYNQYSPPPAYYEQPRGDSLGKRLGRFVTLLGVTFVVVIAVVAVQRFNDETFAFVVGALFVGIPLLLLVIVLGVIALKIAVRPRHEPPQQVTIPPIIMQMPQQPQQPQLPWYGGNGHYDDPPIAGGRRTWDVIGMDEE